MKRVTQTRCYVHYAIVHLRRGQTFPLDMLRYDAAFFLSESDANFVENGPAPEARDIKICTRSTRGRTWDDAFTVARWQSFCVRISNDDIPH